MIQKCLVERCENDALEGGQFCSWHAKEMARIGKDSQDFGAWNALVLDLLREISAECKKTNETLMGIWKDAKQIRDKELREE